MMENVFTVNTFFFPTSAETEHQFYNSWFKNVDWPFWIILLDFYILFD